MSNGLEIKKIRLSQLDISSGEISEIPVSTDESDLNKYLNELLTEVDKGDRKREFEFSSETTEFYVCLSKVLNSGDFEGGKGIVQRLLREEVKTEDRYGHLNKNNESSHVKRGSYLQFVYDYGDGLKYLGVKVDHQEYLDEEDLKNHIGLALSNKIYKAVRVHVVDGKPSAIDVYDSQPTISVYWWSEFLELSELRSDTFNTKKACDETIKRLGPIKSASYHDYLNLRNATITAFKQNSSMDYFQFVEDTFENYSSENSVVKDKLTNIVKRSPRKKRFRHQI